MSENEINPEQELEKGITLLDPLMTAYGFHFVLLDKGSGSGGPFATGYYEKYNRRLNMSVRYSLGEITYQYKNKEICHNDYLRAVQEKGDYPGFSKQVIEAFGHLENDLRRFFSVFLGGSDIELKKIYKYVKKHPEQKGFGALP